MRTNLRQGLKRFDRLPERAGLHAEHAAECHSSMECLTSLGKQKVCYQALALLIPESAPGAYQ